MRVDEGSKGGSLLAMKTKARTVAGTGEKRACFVTLDPSYFFVRFLSSGGWGKIKLKLTTLPRIFIRVVCRFNSIAFAIQR